MARKGVSEILEEINITHNKHTEPIFKKLIFSSLGILFNSTVKYLCIYFVMKVCQIVFLICSRNHFRLEQITLLQNLARILVYIGFQPHFLPKL